MPKQVTLDEIKNAGTHRFNLVLDDGSEVRVAVLDIKSGPLVTGITVRTEDDSAASQTVSAQQIVRRALAVVEGKPAYHGDKLYMQNGAGGFVYVEVREPERSGQGYRYTGSGGPVLFGHRLDRPANEDREVNSYARYFRWELPTGEPAQFSLEADMFVSLRRSIPAGKRMIVSAVYGSEDLARKEHGSQSVGVFKLVAAT